MKLSEVKTVLKEAEKIAFELPNGTLVPEHFHVTEIGKVDKSFIDCGGTHRREQKITFQLWSADDYNHRIHPQKLVQIIDISEKQLQLTDGEVEVEYQGQTVETYGLEHNGNHFLLFPKHTDCLAKDSCGIPQEEAQNSTTRCTPGGGCC